MNKNFFREKKGNPKSNFKEYLKKKRLFFGFNKFCYFVSL